MSTPAPVVIEAYAYAKFNPVLAVGERGLNGYHDIVSVVQLLDVHDTLRIAVGAHDSMHVDVQAPGLPDGDTLVTRAVELLLERAETTAAVVIDIDKRIPVGAGLGGGSSDAGVAMRAVNELLGAPLTASDLVSLAAEVGSDVPFFASGYVGAVVSGRGEQVEAIPVPLPVPPLVLVWPGVAQATGAVYDAYTPSRAQLPTPAEAAASAATGHWYNDLAVPAIECESRIHDCIALAGEAGAGSLVSGSGSTVVAVPERYDGSAVLELEAFLRESTQHWPDAWICATGPVGR
jgi:4-diphosphocytidyl-2-C-methyl-D-erythritol kinase